MRRKTILAMLLSMTLVACSINVYAADDVQTVNEETSEDEAGKADEAEAVVEKALTDDAVTNENTVSTAEETVKQAENEVQIDEDTNDEDYSKELQEPQEDVVEDSVILEETKEEINSDASVSEENHDEDIMLLSSGTEDLTAPELTGVKLSATEVTAPETIEVTVEGTDNLSGLGYATMWFKNGNSSIALNCYNYYYDNSTHQQIYYDDGMLHGELEIDEYKSGIYTLDSMYLSDVAGNTVYYSAESSLNDKFPQEIGTISFKVNNNVEAEDLIDPELTGVKLSTTEVTAPATIEVTVEGTDNLSGLGYATMWFKNGNSSIALNCYNYYYDNSTHQQIYYDDGMLHGELEIDEYKSGIYTLDSMYLSDVAGNTVYYSAESSLNDKFPQEIGTISFKVNNNVEAEDLIDPELTGVRLSVMEVTAPATIEVTVEGTDNLSGLEYATMWFKNGNSSIALNCYNDYYDNSTHQRVNYDDGMLHGELEIDEYKSGIYTLDSMYLSDVAGNTVYYSRSDTLYNKFPDSMTPVEIIVYNDGSTADLLISSTSSDLAAQIKNTGTDANIVVDYSNSSNLSADIFDAIKDTDRTLKLESSGVQWVFKGDDITGESKNIDLSVNMQTVNHIYNSPISQIVGGTPAVVLTFAENGILPGKAQIRIKADYSLRKYLGTESLAVYYYDNTEKKMVQIASEITITSDYYIEFEIEHCSQYIITKGILQNVTIPKTNSVTSSEQQDTSASADNTVTESKAVQTESKAFVWTSVLKDIQTEIAAVDSGKKELGVVRVQIHKDTSVPAEIMSAIAQKNIILSLHLPNNIIVNINGMKVADASVMLRITSTAANRINIYTNNQDMEKTIQIFANYTGANSMLIQTLNFIDENGLYIPFRNSIVFDNNYSAFEIPLVGARYIITE